MLEKNNIQNNDLDIENPEILPEDLIGFYNDEQDYLG